MKADEMFIRKLETYFDEDFNDFTKKRIITYLREYREDIPPVVIKQKQDKFEYRTMDGKFIDRRKKNFITEDELYAEASKLCNERGILINEFLGEKTNKSRNNIGELRKFFCNFIHENYLCSNTLLSKFFNVHHSTISFYLYGKSRPVAQNKSVKKM